MAITEYFEPFTVVIIFKFRKSKIRNEISEGGTATGSETEVIIDEGEYKRYWPRNNENSLQYER